MDAMLFFLETRKYGHLCVSRNDVSTAVATDVTTADRRRRRVAKEEGEREEEEEDGLRAGRR